MALAALLVGFLAAPIAPAAGAAPLPDDIDPGDVSLSVTIGESGGAAAWTAGTSLDGFELTAAPDDGATTTTTTTATDADGADPGVIAALAVVALAAAALVTRR